MATSILIGSLLIAEAITHATGATSAIWSDFYNASYFLFTLLIALAFDVSLINWFRKK